MFLACWEKYVASPSYKWAATSLAYRADGNYMAEWAVQMVNRGWSRQPMASLRTAGYPICHRGHLSRDECAVRLAQTASFWPLAIRKPAM